MKWIHIQQWTHLDIKHTYICLPKEPLSHRKRTQYIYIYIRIRQIRHILSTDAYNNETQSQSGNMAHLHYDDCRRWAKVTAVTEFPKPKYAPWNFAWILIVRFVRFSKYKQNLSFQIYAAAFTALRGTHTHTYGLCKPKPFLSAIFRPQWFV